MSRDDFRRYGCEFFGTLFLVFFAASAPTVSGLLNGALGPYAGGMSSGVALAAVIYAIGYTSGAHVNPALSIAAALIKHIEWRVVPGYIVAQMAGSAAAGFLVLALVGPFNDIGSNLPNLAAGVSPIQALLCEFVLSVFLMWVVAGVGLDRRAHGPMAGLVVGAVVGIEVIVFAPFGGAAMSPARAFGPLLASGNLEHFWIYIVGPVAGMIAGAYLYLLTHNGRRDAAKP
ncbi:MAG: hypothetical protein EXQ98_02535 [Alphaproteobacteria bacterium]|nr:hypothetical protein [Alphaproteobacteria bacterium]